MLRVGQAATMAADASRSAVYAAEQNEGNVAAANTSKRKLVTMTFNPQPNMCSGWSIWQFPQALQ